MLVSELTRIAETWGSARHNVERAGQFGVVVDLDPGTSLVLAANAAQRVALGVWVPQPEAIRGLGLLFVALAHVNDPTFWKAGRHVRTAQPSTPWAPERLILTRHEDPRLARDDVLWAVGLSDAELEQGILEALSTASGRAGMTFLEPPEERALHHRLITALSVVERLQQLSAPEAVVAPKRAEALDAARRVPVLYLPARLAALLEALQREGSG
jgi:hypothetical protein